MSLEWARARALQDQARLRRLVRTADGAAWTELEVAPCDMTLWLAPAAPIHKADAGAQAEQEAPLRSSPPAR